MTQETNWMQELKKFDGLRPQELLTPELEVAIQEMAALLARMEAAQAELIAELRRAS
ncbi:MAG TPA: hypothetical protein VM282_02085 [Acidimicrobiales bacterium]|nr:hypothetical protein [Acidimicrobiales bacterium]